MGMVEDRPDRDTERSFAVIAKVPLFFFGRMVMGGLAIRADRARWPPRRFQMFDAAFLCWELLKNLYNIQGFLSVVQALCSLDKSILPKRGEKVNTLN